ncbi:MAG TPA: flagellar basal body rod protein FlgB [Clostridia bacterium]|nr:flagellar basal body rod protein FlgB [Clostridia bacterium]
MVNGSLFSHTAALERSLDVVWKRHEVISHNISNADTPGYKKKEVVFENELVSALTRRSIQGRQTRKGHLRIGNVPINEIGPKTVDVNSTKMRMDDNNVDIDSEMANLASNTVMHHALIQKLNGEFSRLKSIINEGRR